MCEWMSTKEELPLVHINVLLLWQFTTAKPITIGCLVDPGFYGEEGKQVIGWHSSGNGFVHELERVSHWMHLPELPKE